MRKRTTYDERKKRDRKINLKRNFTWDCVFNETFVQHRYITYSSSKYSNERRTLYMALNRRGQSRKVQVQRKAPLGKLSSYAMVLPLSVSDERVKDLAERILRAREYLQKDSKLPSDDFASIVLAQHPLRHHGYHHLCPPLHFNLLQNPQQEDGTDEAGRDKFRCRKRKKRKKKKRKCKEGEQEGDQCQNTGVKRKKKCQQGEGEEECQKRLEAAKRRRKSRNGDSKVRDDKKKNNNKKKPKLVKNKKKLVCDGEISIDTECVTNRTVRLDENQRDVDKLNELTMTPQSSSHVPQQPTSSPSSTTISTLTTSAISVTTTTSTTPISSSSSSTTVPATSLSTTETHAVAVTPSSSRIPIMSLTSSMTTKSASAVAARTSSSSSTKSEHASHLSSSAGDTTRIGTAK
ncbi:hypothetical protein C0J52_27100 [Blattella germanica]|nr:hypothetical protein C0J52_27100 [Blattella germanica]